MATGGWDEFPELTELQQAKFLVNEAVHAWQRLQPPDDESSSIKEQVTAYLGLAAEVLSGQYRRTAELLVFLEDPQQRNDFGAYYERINENEQLAAALDLASYACGFVCRISAAAAGISILPDPVLESTPAVFDYYRRRALLLS